MTTRRKGLLIVISGPSGVGKDTLIKRLLELDRNLRYSVSCTTRAPRPGEIDGVHYTFLDRPSFQRMIDQGSFLEWATYNANLYGTLTERVDRARADGHDIVLKIEVQGAEQVRERVADGLFIFVVPPSTRELERRQEERNSEPSGVMASRREIAEREMKYAARYDHVVVNDELERAVAEILSIVQHARDSETGAHKGQT